MVDKMDQRKNNAKKIVKFTRPNREPTNKLQWGQYTRDPTTYSSGKKRDAMEEKISALLASMPISSVTSGTAKSTANEYTQTIKDMYQLRHASPNVVAISLYILYQGIDPPFNGKDEPDLEKIKRILNNDKYMEYFFVFANPGEERKRKKEKSEDTLIKKISLKAGILRYIEAILRHFTGDISDDLPDDFLLEELPDEISDEDSIVDDFEMEEEEDFQFLENEEEEEEIPTKRGRGRPPSSGRGRGRGRGNRKGKEKDE